ncbi:MAG: hypothetical protein ABRQ39_30620 [Candidatus Eremiobacterota bacterium]
MYNEINYHKNGEKSIFINEILSVIGSNINNLERSNANKELTGFMAMQGKKYNKELMVIGRSVNGWRASITIDNLSKEKERQEFAEKVFNSDCAMSWVTDNWEKSEVYNTKLSAFWRVIREIVIQLNMENFDITQWASYLVWSNLYKVSPSEGGNPNDILCKLQLPGCIKILNVELETYMPKKVLFLTGMDWAKDFLDGIGAKWTNISSNYVESYGQHSVSVKHQFKFVVAKHPQGKNEEEWVNEVCKFLL